jgi:hypothetical protein
MTLHEHSFSTTSTYLGETLCHREHVHWSLVLVTLLNSKDRQALMLSQHHYARSGKKRRF